MRAKDVYLRFKIKIHNSETQLSKNFFRFYFVLIVTTLQSTDEVPSEAAVMQIRIKNKSDQDPTYKDLKSGTEKKLHYTKKKKSKSKPQKTSLYAAMFMTFFNFYDNFLGLPEPEPLFLAGAGAGGVFWVRLWLLLLLLLKGL